MSNTYIHVTCGTELEVSNEPEPLWLKCPTCYGNPLHQSDYGSTLFAGSGNTAFGSNHKYHVDVAILKGVVQPVEPSEPQDEFAGYIHVACGNELKPELHTNNKWLTCHFCLNQGAGTAGINSFATKRNKYYSEITHSFSLANALAGIRVIHRSQLAYLGPIPLTGHELVKGDLILVKGNNTSEPGNNKDGLWVAKNDGGGMSWAEKWKLVTSSPGEIAANAIKVANTLEVTAEEAIAALDELNASTMETYFRCMECDEAHDTLEEAAECCAELLGGMSQMLARQGIKAQRPLAQLASDYYLLLNLWQVEGDKEAKKRLDEMADEVVPEFVTYLDMACGGELAYRGGNLADATGFENPDNDYMGAEGDSVEAWFYWTQWQDIAHRAQVASAGFNPKNGLFGYGGSFGGEAWKDIADTLYLLVGEKMDPILWLDRVWNLQHNGGCALNKAYQTSDLQYKVLPAHGSDDTSTLLDFASEHVQQLWAYHQSEDAEYQRVRMATDLCRPHDGLFGNPYLGLTSTDTTRNLLYGSLNHPDEGRRRLRRGSARRWQAYMTSE